MDPDRGDASIARREGPPDGPPADPAFDRARGRRRPGSRLRRGAAAGVLCGVLLASTACVGRTGRNDDHVAPGSGGGPSGNVVPHDGG